jgi:hypothetical protein
LHLAAGLFIFCQEQIMNRAQRRAAERQQNNLACQAAEPAIAPEAISAARLAANRENAQKSCGPKTEAGKAAVSLNAVKTGLTGHTVLLPSDDAARYQSHILAYEKEFQPVGPEECALVQSIADTRWRLARIPGLEMALLTKGRLEFDGLFPDHAHVDRAVMIEMHTMLIYEKQLKNLHLQESRLTRRREKEMAELRQIQQERKSKESAALENATRAYLLARSRNQPFDLAALGFEFSKQRFEAHLAGLAPSRKESLVQKALADDDATMQAAA